MSTDNRISAELSAESMERIRAALDTIRTELPFLINITPQERHTMAKLGDKSVAFDEKCVSYMASHPGYLPGFIDPEELRKDRNLRTNLMHLHADFSAVNTAIEDTLTVVGSEIWTADLAYYQTVREGAKRGREGAQAIFDDLRQRFPSPSKTPAALRAKSASSAA